jgi:hypothetical protein
MLCFFQLTFTLFPSHHWIRIQICVDLKCWIRIRVRIEPMWIHDHNTAFCTAPILTFFFIPACLCPPPPQAQCLSLLHTLYSILLHSGWFLDFLESPTENFRFCKMIFFEIRNVYIDKLISLEIKGTVKNNNRSSDNILYKDAYGTYGYM